MTTWPSKLHKRTTLNRDIAYLLLRRHVCGNVNRNLKWAFVETGNLIAISQRRLAGSHVVRLYQRVKRAKNHQKAAMAVARHLAEAAWGGLTKQEVYREPNGTRQSLSSTHG